MITINYQGRLGNNIIQYFAGKILAEKNNLQLNYNSSVLDYWHKYFDIHHNNKGMIGKDIEYISDDNFLDKLSNPLSNKHYILNGFFQKKDFLHTYSKYIRDSFSLSYDEIDKNHVFVHYRMGDTENSRSMLPIDYYKEALSKINYDIGYISSDSIGHPYIIELCNKYNLKPIQLSPLDTINFAKNFQQIVLSEGTFSWWIGFLSKAEYVIFNKRSYNWFGRDIFDFPEWTPLCWDYDANFKPINLNTL